MREVAERVAALQGRPVPARGAAAGGGSAPAMRVLPVVRELDETRHQFERPVRARRHRGPCPLRPRARPPRRRAQGDRGGPRRRSRSRCEPQGELETPQPACGRAQVAVGVVGEEAEPLVERDRAGVARLHLEVRRRWPRPRRPTPAGRAARPTPRPWPRRSGRVHSVLSPSRTSAPTLSTPRPRATTCAVDLEAGERDLVGTGEHRADVGAERRVVVGHPPRLVDGLADRDPVGGRGGVGRLLLEGAQDRGDPGDLEQHVVGERPSSPPPPPGRPPARSARSGRSRGARARRTTPRRGAARRPSAGRGRRAPGRSWRGGSSLRRLAAATRRAARPPRPASPGGPPLHRGERLAQPHRRLGRHRLARDDAGDLDLDDPALGAQAGDAPRRPALHHPEHVGHPRPAGRSGLTREQVPHDDAEAHAGGTEVRRGGWHGTHRSSPRGRRRLRARGDYAGPRRTLEL